MVSGEDVPEPFAKLVHVVPPFNEYWYEVIALPPFEIGAEKATCKELFAAVIEVITGAEAVVAGAALISVEGAEAPMALWARTANL